MKNFSKKIGLERIEILFKEAEQNEEYADRYVFLARKIAMRYNIKIPEKLKRKYCHHCYKYFYPKRYKVRTNSKTKAVEYTCQVCQNITRFGYRNKSR